MKPETEELIASLRRAVDDLLAQNEELHQTVREYLAIHGAQPVKRYTMQPGCAHLDWFIG